jgi:peptidoglycan/LPS O-acetylase OafA/YrhL
MTHLREPCGSAGAACRRVVAWLGLQAGGSSLNKRIFYPELESLRGAAAFSVMMLHIILACLFGGIPDHSLVAYQQLPRGVFIAGEAGVALFNGRSAVTLFFVLSAFVMSANVKRPDLSPETYETFVMRRMFRILPALWVALTFALIVVPRHLGLLELIKVYALLDVSIVPVTWTLVLELAMCLIFPVLLVATRQMGLVAQVAIFVALCWIMRFAPPPLRYGQVYYDWPLLAFYLGLIVPTLGRAAVLALPPSIARGLLALALLAYISPDAARTLAVLKPDLMENSGLVTEVYLAKIAVPVACFYMIAWVLYDGHRSVRILLNSRPLGFLGRTSYSIYVLHPPLLAVFGIHFLSLASGPYFRLLFCVATVVPATLGLSALSYAYVEQPGISAGKKVIALLHRILAAGSSKIALGTQFTGDATAASIGVIEQPVKNSIVGRDLPPKSHVLGHSED